MSMKDSKSDNHLTSIYIKSAEAEADREVWGEGRQTRVKSGQARAVTSGGLGGLGET
jgi:hypothetical protein